MIVATAGHVDHGKTQLVKALTGIDTDTLVEEKRRGLTIDIGFAYLPLEGGQKIGFIDVPGHNRFIRNAICGLAATDFVLLVIAADDGVMPQTEEHLSIIDSLNVKQGAIVISKIDRVSADQLQTVKQLIEKFAGKTIAENWPIFSLSSVSGKGVEDVRDYLTNHSLCLDCGDVNPAQGNFRMPVDRVFKLKGTGLIATGTIFAGTVRQGDYLTIAGKGKRLRVRGLRVQNHESEIGRAGQRCAVNLTGSELDKSLISRGNWIIGNHAFSDPVYRFDAEIRIAENASRALNHWTPVHLHHAASESTARIAVLSAIQIQPGASGLVQVVSDHPVGASFGDYFIIRDQSAKITLGGGKVIDIFPPRRGRARPERIRFLQQSNCDKTETALQNLIEVSPNGVDLKRFANNRNLTPEVATKLFEALDIQVVYQDECITGYSRAHFKKQANLSIRKPQASLAEDQDWLKILKALEAEGVRGVLVTRLAKAVELPPKQFSSLLTGGLRQGLIVKLSEELIMLPNYLAMLNDKLNLLVKQSDTGCIDLAAFRKATGLGRNRAIEILECFDRQGITRRVEQHRVLLPAAGRRIDQLLQFHQTEGKDRTLVGRPVFKTGGGR